MEFDFLTGEILSAIKKIDSDKLYEIRLRKNFPIIVNYGGKRFYLKENGVFSTRNNALICSEKTIERIIQLITEYSVYAFNDKLKKGFITTKNGIRIGVAGECVYGDGLVTIKNISSLNIRIPHIIVGASNSFFSKIHDKNCFYNTLILSPPFCGKTTVLKDVAQKINDHFNKSILILDERGEFKQVTGENIDAIVYADKLYGFEYGIRSMSPEIIITDELSSKEDWNCVLLAVRSGIKIIASCHAGGIFDLKNKINFSNVFDRYVVLKSGFFGQVDGVFDNSFIAV